MREQFLYPTVPTLGRIVHVVSAEGVRMPAIIVLVHAPDDPHSALGLGVFGTTYECHGFVPHVSARTLPEGWCWDWPPR